MATADNIRIIQVFDMISRLSYLFPT